MNNKEKAERTYKALQKRKANRERKKQRDIDAATAFMYKSTSKKNSRSCGDSTGIKSLYGGF